MLTFFQSLKWNPSGTEHVICGNIIINADIVLFHSRKACHLSLFAIPLSEHTITKDEALCRVWHGLIFLNTKWVFIVESILQQRNTY